MWFQTNTFNIVILPFRRCIRESRLSLVNEKLQNQPKGKQEGDDKDESNGNFVSDGGSVDDNDNNKQFPFGKEEKKPKAKPPKNAPKKASKKAPKKPKKVPKKPKKAPKKPKK